MGLTSRALYVALTPCWPPEPCAVLTALGPTHVPQVGKALKEGWSIVHVAHRLDLVPQVLLTA